MIDKKVLEAIEILAYQIDEGNNKKGFNESFSLDKALLLVHGEISEAVEELRSGHNSNEVYYNTGSLKPEGFPVEVCDAIIRLLHICARCDIQLATVMQMKMEYNETRQYKHGKAF